MFFGVNYVIIFGSSVLYGKWHPLGGLNYITTDMIKWNYDFCNHDLVSNKSKQPCDYTGNQSGSVKTVYVIGG